TEQLVLFEVESTHRLGLASAEEDGRHFARATRALAFFQRPARGKNVAGNVTGLADTRAMPDGPPSGRGNCEAVGF
ncbi:hypothetical protein KGZ04_18140, partial [Pseudomonas aeruginosa]|uniref:hypothetical protein n=1 Tax=Pseudomonas aeruginosa TaxID=287 RepID=UPI00233F9089